MPDYACMIQEGQTADRKRAELAQGLARIRREAFDAGPGAAGVEWIVIREGFGWTAGEPSTSSIVVGSVPPGLPLDRREAFLRRVCELWQDVTGCSIDEIVVTAWDGPLPLQA